MCQGGYQVEAGKIWLKEARMWAESKDVKLQNKIICYTMNPIQAMRGKFGKVEINQILEILEQTQEITKCQF